MKKDELKNRVLNGGRGSGQSLRLLIEVYENQIVELQNKVDTLQGFLDHDIEYDMDKAIQDLKKENADLEKQIEKMKELLNRYYMVCAEIPKEYRTMVFDSCMEDTRQLNNKGVVE